MNACCTIKKCRARESSLLWSFKVLQVNQCVSLQEVSETSARAAHKEQTRASQPSGLSLAAA